MRFGERFDRQLRIEGWNQGALEAATLGVVGDADRLASLYTLSAAALGIRRLVVIAPRLEGALVEIAHRLNPDLSLAWLEGYYTHPLLADLFAGCNAIVDLSHYGLANKLLLQQGFQERIPIVRAFCLEEHGQQGFKVFTYVRGREWRELEEIVARRNLPGDHFDDGVLDIIASGVALEETKNILMDRHVSEDVITYERPALDGDRYEQRVCVVGAGALGNFVGLGLAYAGFRHITFFDPDVVEVTNLNRQVLAAGGIGMSKAETLAGTLNQRFGTDAQARVACARKDTDISAYAVVFDCVDNHETRIVLSERCKEERKILISGGTGAEAGQAIAYDPARGNGTPAEVLGLRELVGEQEIPAHHRERAPCAYQPEPSVIMVNQIIAGFMVDACRLLLGGREARNIFYESGRPVRFR